MMKKGMKLSIKFYDMIKKINIVYFFFEMIKIKFNSYKINKNNKNSNKL